MSIPNGNSTRRRSREWIASLGNAKLWTQSISPMVDFLSQLSGEIEAPG